jgi:tripartite-type tricarboxylate transporter receptor subunit TctC
MFTQLTGTDIVHIPYKGSAPAITDLLAGQTNMMFDNIPSSLPHIKSGKLRAIATTGAKRDPALPDLPTDRGSRRQGLRVGRVVRHHGAGRDAARHRHEAERRRGAGDQVARVREAHDDLGYNIIPGTPEQMATMLKDEVARWAPIVKASGAKVD